MHEPSHDVGGLRQRCSSARYYTFAKKNVRFFVLDTNRLDRQQLAWFEQALRSSTEDWKICSFHHPLYSDGLTHGPSLELRVMLEPILVRHGVDAVFEDTTTFTSG
jgi:hypothetical protein